MEEKNDIEVVVSNDSNDLEISPVYEHLNVAKPAPKEDKEKIIIPEEIKNIEDSDSENSSEEEIYDYTSEEENDYDYEVSEDDSNEDTVNESINWDEFISNNNDSDETESDK